MRRVRDSNPRTGVTPSRFSKPLPYHLGQLSNVHCALWTGLEPVISRSTGEGLARQARALAAWRPEQCGRAGVERGREACKATLCTSTQPNVVCARRGIRTPNLRVLSAASLPIGLPGRSPPPVSNRLTPAYGAGADPVLLGGQGCCSQTRFRTSTICFRGRRPTD